MTYASHRLAPVSRTARLMGVALIAGVVSGPLLIAPLTAAAQQAGPPAPSTQPQAAKKSGARAAKGAPSEKAAEKTDAASAQSQIEAGINALEAGKTDAAVASLSSGLAAGSLPAAQTARALYYRGIAYRRQSKPALAIADLTSALWLKGALNEQQRADALQNRAAAYREAGLPDQTPNEAPRSVAAGKTAPSGASSTASSSTGSIATGSGSSGSGGSGSFLSSLFGSSTQPAAQAPASTPAASAVPQVSRPWSQGTETIPGDAGGKMNWNAVTR